MSLQPLYVQFEEILPGHSHDLHAFYIFLAYKDKLVYSKTEENTINSFFGHKDVSITYCFFYNNFNNFNDEIISFMWSATYYIMK